MSYRRTGDGSWGVVASAHRTQNPSKLQMSRDVKNFNLSKNSLSVGGWLLGWNILLYHAHWKCSNLFKKIWNLKKIFKQYFLLLFRNVKKSELVQGWKISDVKIMWQEISNILQFMQLLVQNGYRLFAMTIYMYLLIYFDLNCRLIKFSLNRIRSIQFKNKLF